jgi:hypothetical protein
MVTATLKPVPQSLFTVYWTPQAGPAACTLLRPAAVVPVTRRRAADAYESALTYGNLFVISLLSFLMPGSPVTPGARTADRTLQTTAFSPCLRRNDVAGAPSWPEEAALPALDESAPIRDQAFPI